MQILSLFFSLIFKAFRRVCKRRSFIRHQQHLIDRFADGSVVVPLI